MKLFLYLGAALSLVACSENVSKISDTPLNMDTYLECHSSKRGIVSGKMIGLKDPDTKYAVLLVIREGNSLRTCTGSVISKNVILTAGHCARGAEKNQIYAVFHPDMMCSSGYSSSMKVQSDDILVHKDYKGDSSAKSDLALIKLSSPVPADYPVMGLYDGKSALNSDDLLMVGYGITSESARDSRFLRKVNKSAKLDSRVEGPNIVFDQRNGRGGVCSGDSGGPIYAKVGNQYKIIGVNSVVAGPKEEDVCHNFSIAMYMPSFADWVEQSLQAWGQKTSELR